jgi:hypothetical protein
MNKTLLPSLPVVLILLLAGCQSSYVVPGKSAELSAMAPENIREGFLVKPSQPFPASVVAVRVQNGAYSNYNLDRRGGVYAGGRYAVVLTREFETQEHYEQVAELPGIVDIISLNRMLLPPEVNGPEDLRVAASKLQADLIFLYTLDTVFYDEDKAKPLTVISLGLSPSRKITATTTASALLMDTRTGYLYGAFEATSRDTKHSSSWGSRDSSDAARISTEAEAFSLMLDEFVAAWPRLYAKYGPAIAAE